MKLYTIAHEYTADVTDYYEVKAESREEAAEFVKNGDGEYISQDSETGYHYQNDGTVGYYYVIDSQEIRTYGEK